MRTILFLPAVIILALWIGTAGNLKVWSAPTYWPLQMKFSSRSGSIRLFIAEKSAFPVTPSTPTHFFDSPYYDPDPWFSGDIVGPYPGETPSLTKILIGENGLSFRAPYFWAAICHWILFLLSLIPILWFYFRKKRTS